jgi:hypothetical protein
VPRSRREERPIGAFHLLTSFADLAHTCFRLQIIDIGVTWGSHFVECELVGEEGDRNTPSFRILGIFGT